MRPNTIVSTIELPHKGRNAAILSAFERVLWWMSFIVFVGGAMVWFAATGYCIMANMLYAIGAEPRLNPEKMPSGRCANCAMSPVCVSGQQITAA